MEKALKFLVVSYLKLFTENEKLRKENSQLKKDTNEILTESADHVRMIRELQEEIEQLKTVH